MREPLPDKRVLQPRRRNALRRKPRRFVIESVVLSIKGRRTGDTGRSEPSDNVNHEENQPVR
jgi:hypothetical protein